MHTNELCRFEAIISLPHHTSVHHRAMSAGGRAAQFASFAALSGYEAAVKETARLTAGRKVLDENEKERLNRRLCMIERLLLQQPMIEWTYFVPDSAKSGGAYVTYEGVVKKIDLIWRKIILTDGTVIPIDEIAEIDGEIFLEEENAW